LLQPLCSIAAASSIRSKILVEKSRPEIPLPRGGFSKPEYDFRLRVTPTMEAGIAENVWSLEEIVGLLP
jgi:hypothetical protein